MAVAHRPETIVALRARHEALRIAEAVFRGSGVNVDQLNCHACGAELDWRGVAAEYVAMDCPACGAVNELPCHLRFRVPPPAEDVQLDYASAEPDRRHWWNDVNLPVALEVARAPLRVHAEPAPVWLKMFCLTCLAVVLTSLALMALWMLN